jgi:hypothetical protein
MHAVISDFISVSNCQSLYKSQIISTEVLGQKIIGMMGSWKRALLSSLVNCKTLPDIWGGQVNASSFCTGLVQTLCL